MRAGIGPTAGLQPGPAGGGDAGERTGLWRGVADGAAVRGDGSGCGVVGRTGRRDGEAEGAAASCAKP